MRVSVSKDTHYDCWNDYSSDLCIMTNETELNICLELLQQSPFQSGSDAVDTRLNGSMLLKVFYSSDHIVHH